MPIELQGRQEISTSAGPDNILPLAPNPPFVYFHADQGWMYIDGEEGGMWLPYLNKVVGMRGANGVDNNGGMAPALATIQSKGHQVISPSDKRLGPYINYRYSFDCASKTGNRGKYYVSAFETPVIRGERVRWKADEKGYHQFLKYLVDRNLVAPMGRDILEEKVDIVQDRITRLQAQGSNPSSLEKAERAQKRIEGMKAAWERQFGAAEEEDGDQ